MKIIQLKSLIREQVQRVQLQQLDETIVSDIMALILSPKIKKAVKMLKNDPDFQELERQIKLSKDELDAIQKRIERNLDKQNKIVRDLKKAGIKVDYGMNSVQMFRAWKDWSDDIDKHIKSHGAKAAWEKYFNK